MWLAGWKAGTEGDTLATRAEQEIWQSDDDSNLGAWGGEMQSLVWKGWQELVKLAPAPSPVIPSLFYPINRSFSGMYLISLLYWFLPFILHSGLKFSFSPQRPSLIFPSLSTYCNVVASAHPTIHWSCYKVTCDSVDKLSEAFSPVDLLFVFLGFQGIILSVFAALSHCSFWVLVLASLSLPTL